MANTLYASCVELVVLVGSGRLNMLSSSFLGLNDRISEVRIVRLLVGIKVCINTLTLVLLSFY